MANVQVTAVQNQQNAHNANEQPLMPITLLLRFLYKGSTSSSIPVKVAPNVINIDNTLSCVIEMANARAQLPISTIRKVYQLKKYIRVDEVLIALAYCAKQTRSEELRMLANNEAISMINDQADFLLFVSYCTKISVVLRGERHSNFGHGMCRIIEKWYEKWSPVELANMFGEHRGMHSWTHQTVICKAHMRTEKRTASEPAGAAAAAAAVTVAATTSNSVAQNANDSVATENNENRSSIAQTEPTNGDDREQVLHFIFCNGSHKYIDYLENETELGVGAQRLKNLQILKTNENIDSAIESIRQHKFTITQMPAHLLEKEKIWEVLIPTLSVRQLLHYFHTVKDHSFLNENTPFARAFIDALANPIKIKTEQICPIELFILKRLYSKNVRYLGTKKAEYYNKKVLKRKISINTMITERLNEMFNTALHKSNAAPAKFMVVMDLRRGNSRKPVLRNKHIKCFEAAFLLAYSIFVRERDALVYTFTNEKNKLNALHHLMPKNDFELAKEVVDLESVEHTYQSLTQPIAEATALKKKIDMFVVVVDSVARFCRQGQVPVQEFTEYRAKFNDRAKYIVVNLTRAEPDLNIPQTENMKGFFEICGFTEDTPKILHALATHCFT